MRVGMKKGTGAAEETGGAIRREQPRVLMGGVHPLRTLSPRVLRGSNAGRGEKSYRGCRGDRRGRLSCAAETNATGVKTLKREIRMEKNEGDPVKTEVDPVCRGAKGRKGDAVLGCDLGLRATSSSEINRIEAGFNGDWVQIMGLLDRIADYKAIETSRQYFGLQQNRWPHTLIAERKPSVWQRLRNHFRHSDRPADSRRWRSPFRADAYQHSILIPITIPV